ncbi:hypothetical protein FKM82_027675 [Ascaphus truei]
MGPEIAMPFPVCLIENREGKNLVINQEATQILYDITQPVVVVAIVGKYRTGKSYLMNKLAGKRNAIHSSAPPYISALISRYAPS